MKNAAGILLVIYLFFLVPLLAGAFIDAAAGVKRRNISSTYANGFVAMLGIFWGVVNRFQCDCRRGERPVLDGIVRRPCVRPQPSDQRAGRHGTQYGRPARKRLLVCGRT